MQPKHPQIFPTPNRPWRILKAHMAGSPKLRQWTSTGSWKLMTVLMSGLSVLVTQVTSGEHDHLSIRCQGAIEVIDLFWMFWHLLSWARLAQLQASPTHGKRCRWQGGSWPQSRSTEIYWDLPSLSFFSNLWTSLISCGFFWYLWPSISTSIGIYWNTSLLLWRPFLAEAEKNPSKEKKESHKGAAKVALLCFYIVYIYILIYI